MIFKWKSHYNWFGVCKIYHQIINFYIKIRINLILTIKVSFVNYMTLSPSPSTCPPLPQNDHKSPLTSPLNTHTNAQLLLDFQKEDQRQALVQQMYKAGSLHLWFTADFVATLHCAGHMTSEKNEPSHGWGGYPTTGLWAEGAHVLPSSCNSEKGGGFHFAMVFRFWTKILLAFLPNHNPWLNDPWIL